MKGPRVKVGLGLDAHAFAKGRRLVLGGVDVPYEQGLAGHSDADVLCHAISDAVLGAAGLGDIGRHFPDSDPAYKDADSLQLLAHCVSLALGQGYAVANVDAVVIAQAPRLAPYMEQMNRNLARVLDVEAACVNVKATTTEAMGFTGRKEGIAAQAACLLERVE